MSRRGIFLFSAFLLFLSFPVAAQKKNDKKTDQKKQQQDSKSREQELTNKALKKWLDEDVAYIITDEEKSAFKALKTDEEREQFIEQFWLRRDPNPDTIENEYKEEHYRRIAYANERFQSGKPGWKTDRGRIYIMYGKPDEIESHPAGGQYERPFEEGGGTTNTYPFELWRYRYIEGIGNDVNLEFVDPTMTGEYHLTSDPNEKDALLHVDGMGLTLDEQMNGGDKGQRITGIGEPKYGNALGNSPTRNNNQFDRLALMANIFRPPETKFKDLESIVTTKLSYNLLPFDFRTDFIRVTEESVLTPVTILLQNRDLAFHEQEGIQRATVNVYGKVTAINGRVAQVFEDTISQDVPDALFQQSLQGASIHQRILPLRPGLYKIDLVLKDINSGNVGTINQRLAVPRFPDEKLSVSSLILADLVEDVPSTQIASGAFILGSSKVRPNVTDQFKRDKDLNVWFQVYNLKLDEATHKPSATVEMLISRNGQEVKKTVEKSTELSNAAAQMTMSQTFALKDFEPGEYSLQVKVTDDLTKEVVASTGKFAVR